jgi:hypothetical protein
MCLCGVELHLSNTRRTGRPRPFSFSHASVAALCLATSGSDGLAGAGALRRALGFEGTARGSLLAVLALDVCVLLAGARASVPAPSPGGLLLCCPVLQRMSWLLLIVAVLHAAWSACSACAPRAPRRHAPLRMVVVYI